MAPRTRRATQRLAAINAEYAQDSSAQVAANLEQVKDNSVVEESGNSHLLDNEEENVGSDGPAAKSTSSTKSITSRNKHHVASRDPRSMFGPKSKLTKIDFTKFLSDEKTWASLTNEQQAILKAMCPKDSAWGKSTLEQPTLGFLLYDMHWKSDVRAYTENMANGYYDPNWIREAEEATSERSDGKFDNWKLKNFEEYWGQKMDPERKELGEKKQTIALSDFVAEEQLQIGDEWSYSRSFGRGRKLATVEHKFHMTSIDDYGRAQFRICLPASTKNLKRFSDDLEDEDGDGRIPERITYGKQVKIMVEETDKTQQQSTITVVIPTASDKSHDDATGTSSDPTITDMIDQSDLTTLNIPSVSTGDQSTEMALHTSGNRAAIQPPKSILKKPSMAMFLIAAAEVEELEKELLKHSGHDQNPSRTDSWKFFTIRRDGQDIGSLQALRDEYQKKLAS